MSYDAYFDKQTVQAYREEMTSNPFTPVAERHVNYWVDGTIAKAYCCSPGPGGNTNNLHATDVAQVVYLDVGRWGGGVTWPAKRHFGIVYSDTVFLCRYSTHLPTCGPPFWEPHARDWQYTRAGCAIKDLLVKLSSSPKLGRVVVQDAVASTIAAPMANGKHIFVVLGDLHLPVMTEEDRTYLYPPPQGSGLVTIPDYIYAAGRIPFVPVPKWAEWLYPLIKVWVELNGPLLELDSRPEYESSFNKFQALHWYKKFKPADPYELAADIFEPQGGAADQLRAFLWLVHEYYQATATTTAGGDQTSVRFIQVGDMFELWCGLLYAHNAPDEVKSDFVTAWMTELTTETTPDQVKLVVDLKALVKETSGRILIGNHDDYAIDKLYRTLSLHEDGLYIEHGHQGDVFNNAKGRQLGHYITQAVTDTPSLRKLDDPLAGYMSYVGGSMPRRLEFLRHALHKALHHPTQRIGIYVMGHTHRPCVKLLRVRHGDPDHHEPPKPLPITYPPIDKP